MFKRGKQFLSKRKKEIIGMICNYMEDIIKSLPPEARKELLDFIEFLLKKYSRKPKKLKLDWAGGLAELRNKYDGLTLQKKSLEWWER